MHLKSLSSIFLSVIILAGCSFKKSPAEKNIGGDKVTANGTQLPTIEDVLWDAVAAGGLDDLQVLIEQNPDIDLNVVRKGETPLSVALRRGDFEIAAVLMSYGASPFVPLQIGGKSAFDSVDLYAARFRSVITSQADLIMAHFSTLLINGSSHEIVEFFLKNSIPCEMALEKIRDTRTRGSYGVLNETTGVILSHEVCKSLSGKHLEQMLIQEFMSTLRSYSQDLIVLKTLVQKNPYIPTIVIENQNLVGFFNPVFLIKNRNICGNPFKDKAEVRAWRNELISLFPSQSGIAYEIAVRKENKISVSSGRALVVDFESMDKHDERKAVVVSLTGIENFFECEKEH